MTRYLVVGNPIVTLAQEAYLPDGAVIVEDRRIVAVGPRAQMEEARHARRDGGGRRVRHEHR